MITHIDKNAMQAKQKRRLHEVWWRKNGSFILSMLMSGSFALMLMSMSLVVWYFVGVSKILGLEL